MPARHLRWFEVPLALALLIAIWTPLLNVFSGRLPRAHSWLLLTLASLAGGLCLTAQSIFLFYFREQRSVRAAFEHAGAPSLTLGTLATAGWLLWIR